MFILILNLLLSIFPSKIENTNFEHITIETNKPFIIIDKNSSLLSYFEFNKKSKTFNAKYEMFFSYGLKTGDKQKEGDEKTPEGVYFVIEYKYRSELPSYFGAGALVLNYPNPIDLKLGKTGSNIWIHGAKNKERLKNIQNTKGCVVLKNDNFKKLKNNPKLKQTPIIIVKNIKNLNYSYSSKNKIKVSKKNLFNNKKKSNISLKYEVSFIDGNISYNNYKEK